MALRCPPKVAIFCRVLTTQVLKGLGAAKVKKWASVGVKSVEALAVFGRPSASTAISITGRSGTSTQAALAFSLTLTVAHSPSPSPACACACTQVGREAIKTVMAQVELAKTYLKSHGGWPPVDATAAATATAAAAAAATASAATTAAATATTASAAAPMDAATAAVDAAATTTPVDGEVAPFLPFAASTGYHGRKISAHLVDDIAFTVCEDMEPFLSAIILGTLGDVWKFDHSFKCVSNVVASNPLAPRQMVAPFEAFVALMNEIGQPMWYGFLASTSYADLRPHLLRVLARHRRLLVDPNWLPKAIYIDNCCQLRELLQADFPTMPILLDPYHWFERWDACIEQKQGSVLLNVFNAEMRDAVLTPVLEEYDKAHKALEVSKKRKPKHAEVLQCCSRVILQPDQLRKSVDAVFEKWFDRDKRIVVERCHRKLAGAAESDTHVLLFKSLRVARLTHQKCMAQLNMQCRAAAAAPRLRHHQAAATCTSAPCSTRSLTLL